MMRYAIALILMTVQLGLHAQYTMGDTLRGSITSERSWWDLIYYHLDIDVDPSDSTIHGQNTIQYEVLSSHNVLQVDLQPPLEITRVSQDGMALEVESKGNAHFVQLLKPQKKGEVNEIVVEYGGRPHVAIRAPWDGGISWKYDDNGKPFVASSCQGIGASIWWPCKDHMYDEVDSMLMTVSVPEGLMNVSNGRLRSQKTEDGKNITEWYVDNPINNYGVNINVGDYVHFGEQYEGEAGALDLNYYVLRDNLEKAKKQFEQGAMTIEGLEYWFGPYPFYKDGYKLVEAPYLGMEHQSSVTYGNGYQNGYLGRDLSRTGWGLKFDFIIIHETGHEWFANNITYQDIADMWIHESFTAYSEALYAEYWFGPEAGAEYVVGTRANVLNDKPIIGVYGVNSRGSGDMYYKGSNMLHTIRQVVNDDIKWRNVLRGLNEEFYHQTVTTQQVEDYMSTHLEVDLSSIFDQYLRDVRIPNIELKRDGGDLSYRWTNVIGGFNMPLDIKIGEDTQRIYPKSSWQTLEIAAGVPGEVDENFFVTVNQ